MHSSGLSEGHGLASERSIAIPSPPLLPWVPVGRMMSFGDGSGYCLAGSSHVEIDKTPLKCHHFHHNSCTPPGCLRVMGWQVREALLSQALHCCHGYLWEE